MAEFGIVTVCYNAQDIIEDTIQSVLSQDFKDFDYLIVDGASTDATLDIIKEYADKDSRVRYISEPDEGLYDAMNKGAKNSKGDYIQMLNAGDVLFDNKVLSGLDDFIRSHNLWLSDINGNGNSRTILFGNIIYVYEDGREESRLYGPSCGKSIYYATGDCVNHQSIFASRQCFADEKPFLNEIYRINADRDWMMRNTRMGAKWISTGNTIVRYALTEDSISVKNPTLMKKEERIALKRNYPIYYPIYLIFDGCRNNKVLAKLLHSVYKLLYIRKK